MAQIAQKRLFFTLEAAASDDENDNTDVYLDIPAALTAVNRKQYHQVTTSGDPLCYTVTIQCIASAKTLTAATAPNTWTTRNAVKKVAVGWKEQMKNSGIRMSELPTYARRFRCAFDSGAHETAPNGQALLKHLVPDDATGGRLFQMYTPPSGTPNVTYFNSNEIVLLSIASETAPDEAYRCSLMGLTDAAGTSFGMIYEYLKSRRNMREESDPDVEFPDADGLLNTIFATSESLADDVTTAAQGYNTDRPYDDPSSYSKPYVGAMVAEAVPNYQETFSAPLGLIKFTGDFAASSVFIIDVEAVYEM